MATEVEQLDGEDVEGGAEKPAKGGKKGLIIGLVLLLVLGGGGFAGWKMFAGKLKGIVAEQTQVREMVIEGVVSIVLGENPRAIESKLHGYLH